MFVYIALVFLLVAILILWRLPKIQVQLLENSPETGHEVEQYNRSKERIKLEDDTRKTLAQIFGGVVIIGGLIFTYNTYYLQTEKQDLDRQAQYTDRFDKAIKNLDSKEETVIIGGLYELERVSQDSSKEFWPVMEILCAYVRSKSPATRVRRSETNQTPSNMNNDGLRNVAANSNAMPDGKTVPAGKISEDIQVAITIIGRRDDTKESGVLNLSNTYLAGADFSNGNFSRANFYGSNLTRSVFHNTNFSYVNLQKANLSEIDSPKEAIERTYFKASKMWVVLLGGAKFEETEFRGANLSFMDLSNINFSGLHLEDANLFGADLSHTDFSNSFLTKADLSKTFLLKTNFSNAHLDFAKFVGAGKNTASTTEAERRAALSGEEIWSFDLSKSTLQGTDFSNADLSKAISDGAKLTFEQIFKLIIDENTKLPEGLEPRKADLLGSFTNTLPRSDSRSNSPLVK